MPVANYKYRRRIGIDMLPMIRAGCTYPGVDLVNIAQDVADPDELVLIWDDRYRPTLDQCMENLGWYFVEVVP